MENLKMRELTIQEMQEVNGGSILGSLLVGAAFLLGMLLGEVLMDALLK